MNFYPNWHRGWASVNTGIGESGMFGTRISRAFVGSSPTEFATESKTNMPKVAIIEVDRTYDSDGDDYVAMLRPHLDFTEVQESDIPLIRLALGYNQILAVQVPPVGIQDFIERGREINEERLRAEEKRKAAAEKRAKASKKKSEETEIRRLKKALISGKKAQDELEKLGVRV